MPGFVFRTSTIFLIVLLTGFLFANNILVLTSFAILCYLAFGYFVKVPRDIEVQKVISKGKITSGEILEIKLKVFVKSGIGILEICDVIPMHFELIEGSNYFVMWKGLDRREASLSYTVKCTSSGTYPMNITKWKSTHSVCNFYESGWCENDISVEVLPRLLELRKVRGMSVANKIPMPQGALSSMGMTTNEFKEIRLYSPGDSFKSINWKVTARSLLKGHVWPVVNEFEKEGKKSAWIFLDTSRTMNFGSNVRNVKEYSIEVVNSLSDYYLKHNCSVSFLTYGYKKVAIYGGSGRKQYYRILKELIGIKDGKTEIYNMKTGLTSLSETVYSNRQHFLGLRPLFVVITRFCTNNYDEIKKGIEQMTKYTVRKGVIPSVMVVNISGYSLMSENQPEKLASSLLDSMNRVISKEIRKKCIWIDWDPSRESFTEAILKQVVTVK